jgi:uncharacterized membrane protein
VASSIARTVYPDSLMSRIEPVRARLLDATGSVEPPNAERAATAARVDARFGDHRLMIYIHVVLGSCFLLIAPFQFNARIRRTHPHLHRWTGRALVGTGVTVSVAGLVFGLFIPFAGTAERVVVATFGAAVIAALLKAVILIRRGEVDRHRAWMIRAFALMLGISTVRLAAAVLDFTLTPLGYTAEAIFVTSLWLGWGSTLAAAELWLRLSVRRTSYNHGPRWPPHTPPPVAGSKSPTVETAGLVKVSALRLSSQPSPPLPSVASSCPRI